MKKELETTVEETIFRVNDDIYFYDEVNTENILKVILLINQVNNELDVIQNQKINLIQKIVNIFKKEETQIPYVKLHINSYGGDVYACNNMINTIMKNKYPIVTFAEGFVASAGASIFLAGNIRIVQEYAMILFHDMRGYFHGTRQEIKDGTYNWDLLYEMDVNFMIKQTKMTREEIEKMINDEKNITSTEALKLGIATQIL